MSFRACSAVFRSSSERRFSKQIRNVDWRISQTDSLVRSSPTGESISVLSTSMIFIRTTSSELGSTPTNLEDKREYIKACMHQHFNDTMNEE